MGVVWTFLLSSILSLWETARYRLKYCLKGPLNPKQPTKIQNQTKTTTTTMATPVKPKDSDEKSHQSQRNGSSESASCMDVPKASHENDIIYGDSETENKDDVVAGKFLQIIQCSYPKPVMKKMRKLFFFIVHFGRDILTFNPKGNSHIGDPKSNILDLLEASVTEQFSDKPVGYRSFLQALHDNNVPSNFYMCDFDGGKWRRDRRTAARWRPY